jgi:arylsulfatase A-like enzyme
MGALDYFTHSYGGGEGLYEDEVKVEEQGYLTDLIADKAVDHIRDYTGKKTPFLLSVHFNAPHWPWEGPKTGPLTLPGGGAAMGSFETGDLETYGAMVTQMDVAIGRILKALEQNSFTKNTVVVFTSDNGGERFSDTWPFTGKKTELLEGGLRIPGLVRWPGKIKAGSVSTQVAMSMDWMPTFVAMANGKIHDDYQSDGMDLTPALLGGPPVSRKVFWRYRQNGQRAMRDGNMKWLEINENQFLFNVVKDPLERANLSRMQPEIFERMAREWDEWNANMLDGSAIPSSYHFNSRQLADHYSPQDGGAGPGRGAAKGKGALKGKGAPKGN